VLGQAGRCWQGARWRVYNALVMWLGSEATVLRRCRGLGSVCLTLPLMWIGSGARVIEMLDSSGTTATTLAQQGNRTDGWE
jgi:hypothetical protein